MHQQLHQDPFMTANVRSVVPGGARGGATCHPAVDISQVASASVRAASYCAASAAAEHIEESLRCAAVGRCGGFW